ncbi:uncharacterized protein LOC111076854 [Drosophila obscura]|uniref:uncharacterized protein LOC111076854 n=1 Tax=Drosophila obscura TaxID=7282 RepID=UPI001BB227F1|nr:uncharacterized protein LOC111076854 [Drosophila obscura]
MSSMFDKFLSQQFREVATSTYAIVAVTGVVAYLIYTQTRFRRDTYDEQDYRDAGHINQMEPLSGLMLTKVQLLEQFNCNNPDRRYLVALRAVVYDVSNVAEDFGPEGRFATWSGHELTKNIKAEAIRKKKNVERYMQKWNEVLENCFFVAGELIDYKEETEENAEENTDENAEGNAKVNAEGNAEENAEVTAELNANIDVTVEDLEDDEDDLQSRGDRIRWDENNTTIIASR